MKKSLLYFRGALLFAFCTFYVVSGYSQEAGEAKGKPSVYIDYFTRSADVPFVWVEGLRNHVIEGIQKMDRVILIDVDSQSALRVEKERRESEDTSTGENNDMDRVAAMSQLGANYIIEGFVSSMSAKKEKLDDGSIYYSASVAYTLKVINPKDGTLVGTKTLKHGEGITDVCTGSTPDEAVSKACAKAVKAVREFVDENFKMEGTILEISAEKKGEAKELYISLGSDNGVGDGAFFAVFVSRQVAGRSSFKEIGRLKVKAVEGGDITLCEVKKGGKEIKDAVDAKQNVVVRLVPKEVGFFGKAIKAVDSL